MVGQYGRKNERGAAMNSPSFFLSIHDIFFNNYRRARLASA